MRVGAIRQSDPSFRAVVFSQFTTFLDLIQLALERERLTWHRFDGTMDVRRRSEAIAGFKEQAKDDSPKVLIVSLKAGGVGLNVSCLFGSEYPKEADEAGSSSRTRITFSWRVVFALVWDSADDAARLDGLLVELCHRESGH